MGAPQFFRKAGEMNNGDKNNQNSRPRDENRRRKNEARRGAQKISPSRIGGICLTGFGVRVEILEQGVREARCRRLQDDKEIIVPVKELMELPKSDPEADSPRELFQHNGIRWRDPAEIP